jgi:hypothetical protein
MYTVYWAVCLTASCLGSESKYPKRLRKREGRGKKRKEREEEKEEKGGGERGRIAFVFLNTLYFGIILDKKVAKDREFLYIPHLVSLNVPIFPYSRTFVKTKKPLVVHKYLLYSKLHQDFTRFSIKSPSFTQGP